MKEVVSSDYILERLQRKLDRDLTATRHPIKLLIMERLERLPMPQSASRCDERGADSSLVTSAVAVFNTTELLEAILSHLPMEDLLVSCSVNRAFYKLASTAPTLQRKLFLLPANRHPPKWKLVCDKINGPEHAVVSNPSDHDNTPSGPKLAYGEPAPVARLNPLLKLPEQCLTTADNIGFRHFADSRIAGTRCCDSAILDLRILESRAWPHMHLTDPPCTCAHIDIEYAVQTLVDGPVLKVRRTVYDPAGVTFGAIFHALHAKGSVVKYYGRGYASCPCLLPDTTIRKELQFLEQQGFRLSLTPDKLIVEFCYLFIPSDAKFDEMERTGRVEKCEPPSLWPSALG